jgi:hypothetical protein
MTEPEILQAALAAQSAGGPMALVQVVLPRVPGAHCKNMRLRPYQGPWGKIIAVEIGGTRAEFEARKIAAFLSGASAKPTRGRMSAADRSQIKLRICPDAARGLQELAHEKNTTLNALIEGILTQSLRELQTCAS